MSLSFTRIHVDWAERGVASGSEFVAARAGVGILLPDESRLLRESAVRLEVSAGFSVPTELAELSEAFTAWWVDSRPGTFNGPMLTLRSDLPAPGAVDDLVVRVAASDFFSYVSTNLMAGYDTFSARGELLVEGASLFTGVDGGLLPFSRSALANAIGSATLAFTSDRKLVLVEQPGKDGEPGTIDTAGAGGVEPADIRPTLQETLIAGATRELVEECNVHPEEVGRSRLLGYGRYLSQGGIPQFYSATELHVSSAQLATRGIRAEERAFVASRHFVDLPYPSPRATPADLLPARFRSRMSMSLAMGLAAFIDAARSASSSDRREVVASAQ